MPITTYPVIRTDNDDTTNDNNVINEFLSNHYLNGLPIDVEHDIVVNGINIDIHSKKQFYC